MIYWETYSHFQDVKVTLGFVMTTHGWTPQFVHSCSENFELKTIQIHIFLEKLNHNQP